MTTNWNYFLVEFLVSFLITIIVALISFAIIFHCIKLLKRIFQNQKKEKSISKDLLDPPPEYCEEEPPPSYEEALKMEIIIIKNEYL